MSVRSTVDCFLRNGAALAALVLAAGMFLPFVLKQYSEWDMVYVRAAADLVAGEDIYRLENGYLYPPFMAWVAIPFTYLPASASRAVWYLINMACLLLMLRWGWRLSGGGPLDGPQWSWRERLLFFVGLLSGIRYAFDALAHQQTDLVVGAALFGGCALLSRGRVHFSACSFGLAAAIKCTPLLWTAYLAYRRQWRAALLLLALAIGLNLLPDLASRPPTGSWWLNEWINRFVLPMGRPDHATGRWGADVLQNQSLAGAGHRWFMTGPSWTEQGFDAVDRFDARRVLPIKLAVVASSLTFLAVAGGTFYLTKRKSSLSHWPPAYPAIPEANGCGRAAGEYSLVLLLMVLLSPMSSKPHFCTLILPGFWLARQAWRTGSKVSWALLAAAAASTLVSIKDLWGTEWAEAALWYGAVTMSAAALFAACIHALLTSSAANNTATFSSTPHLAEGFCAA